MAHKRSHHFSSSENADSYSAYSDDFENDSRPNSGLSGHRHHSGNLRKASQHLSGLESEATSSSFVSHRSPKKYGERRKKTHKSTISSYKSAWKPNSSRSASKRTPLKNDTVHARLLSAQRNRLNTLGNELGEANVKLDTLVKENRLLKTLQHRQEKSLRKFEDTEGDLPRLISQNMEDQRILKARLRKSQEAERISESKLKESNDEILRMQNTLRRLKKIIFDKNLGERSELAKQLAAAEEKQMETERKNLQLEKKLHLTSQSFSRQLRTEQHKHKETKEELLKLQNQFGSTINKLKEKERALEVSNIYALRSKQSPEKSFLNNKLAIISRSDDEPTSAAPHVPLLQRESSAKAMEEMKSFSSEPAASILAVTNEMSDYRKKLQSPAHSTPVKSEREDSQLLDLGESTLEKVETQLNDLDLLNGTKENATQPKQHKDTNPHRSVFLTSNYSPNSTFISDRAPSPKISPPAEISKPKTPVVEKVDFAAQLKAEKKMDEEQKKLEEDRRKKAALLAKMKDLEEESGSSSIPERKPDADDLSQLLATNPKPVHKPFHRQEKVDKNPRGSTVMDRLLDLASREIEMRNRQGSPMDDILMQSFETVYDELSGDDDIQEELHSDRHPYSRGRPKRFPFVNEVENLHMGIPSVADVRDSVESEGPELTFGGYAPTVAAPPKRKPSNQVTKKQFSPSGSESDEPLLDIGSGKINKKNDLLQQLFGEQTSQSTSNGPIKKESSFTSTNSSHGSKAMPRAKPIHSGYPWEKDVVAAPPVHSGNGDAYGSSLKKASTASPVVKPFPFSDDDIEEVTL